MVSLSLLGGALYTFLSVTGMKSPPAYLDPGSGSFLLQLLAAGILGSLFALRAFWGRLKNKITRRKHSDQDETDRE